MITKSQYDILLRYKESPQRFEDTDLPDSHELLQKRGYITSTDTISTEFQLCHPVEWSITASGVEAIEQFEEQRQQRKFQNRISVASIIVPIVTFVVGLIVEHFTSAIEIVLQVFH